MQIKCNPVGKIKNQLPNFRRNKLYSSFALAMYLGNNMIFFRASGSNKKDITSAAILFINKGSELIYKRK